MTTMNIRKLLTEAESRLSETVQAFTASKTVNDWCIGRPEAIYYLNKNWFWRTAYAGFQIAIFTGIYALVDKRQDCATLCLVADELNSACQGSVPSAITDELTNIRHRYEHFRHKVFAHTDKNRAALATEFDAIGLTWASIQSDLDHLDYSLKVLWALSVFQVAPTYAEAKQMLRSYDLVNASVAADTLKVLKSIA